VGGYDVMVNGDWIKDKRNYLIGWRLQDCGAKVDIAVQEYNCGAKDSLWDKVKVRNKRWICLNNVNRVDKKEVIVGQTHMG